MEMGKVSIAILLFVTSLVGTSNAATNSTAVEEVEGSANVITRSESTPLTPAEEEHKQKVEASFKKIIIHVLNIGGEFIPGLASIEQFLGVIDAINGNNGDIWKQIEGKVKFTIAESQTKRHFKNFKAHWDQFKGFMKLGDKFDRSDLVSIQSKKSVFFPQDHDDLLYSSQFITSIEAFLVYLTGGYLDLITRKKIKKCSLAEELASLRGDIIQAAKDLHKKRYQSLKGTGYKIVNPGQKRGLTYTDMAVDSNNEFTVVGLKVLEDVFEATEKNTTDTIMEMVNAYNEFLIEDMCQEGCAIPAKITKSDVDFGLPKVCWEVDPSSHSGTCLLPCDLYGETAASHAWCPTNLSMQKWGTLLKTTGYDWCTARDKDGWNECMVTSGTENIWSFLNKKERKALKKKQRKV